MAALPARDRTDFEDELDRLRMMRVAEEGSVSAITFPTSP